MDFNEKHAVQVSVSPMMQPLDVAECLQALADGFMKAAKALLLISGDFKAERANRNVVEIYPLEKSKLVTRNCNGQIHGEEALAPYPGVYYLMRKVKSHWPAGDVYLSSSAPGSVDRA